MMAQLQRITHFVQVADVPAASIESESATTEKFADVLDRVSGNTGQSDETPPETKRAIIPSAATVKMRNVNEATETTFVPGAISVLQGRHGLPPGLLTTVNKDALSPKGDLLPTLSAIASASGASDPDKAIAINASTLYLGAEVSVAADPTQGAQTADLQERNSGVATLLPPRAETPPGHTAAALPISPLTNLQAVMPSKGSSTTKVSPLEAPKSDAAQSFTAQPLDSLGSTTLDPGELSLPVLPSLQAVPIGTVKESGRTLPVAIRVQVNGPLTAGSHRPGGTALSASSQDGLAESKAEELTVASVAHGVMRHESEDSNSVAMVVEPAGSVVAGNAAAFSLESSGLNVAIHAAGPVAQSAGSHPAAAEVQASQPSSLEPAAPSSGTQGTDVGLPLTRLRSTPTSLEVGVSSGAHGWLKVRAELTADGVSASLTSGSPAAANGLRFQLPGLASFLQSEKVPLSSLVVMTSSAPAMQGERHLSLTFNQGVDTGQAGFAAGADGGRDGTHGRSEADRDPPTAPAGRETFAADAQAGSSSSGYTREQGLGGSSSGSSIVYGSGGSWLNVRV